MSYERSIVGNPHECKRRVTVSNMRCFSEQLKITANALPAVAFFLVFAGNIMPFLHGGWALVLLPVTVIASLPLAWAGGVAWWALWRGGGGARDELRRVKNCQQILYLAAGVGAAMLGFGFSSGGGGTECLTVVHVTSCRAAADPPETTCLELVGLLYLVSGAIAVVLEPRRHALESEVENTP